MASFATQLLDELMGRSRNLNPNEKRADQISWTDPDVCKYHLCGFCPHDLFTNTRADLGLCNKIHDDEMIKTYSKSSRYLKMGYEEDFLSYLQNLVGDVDKRIKRGHQRLTLNQMAASIQGTPQNAHEEKTRLLSQRINDLVEQAEKLGCEGKVEEAQGVLKLCDQLKEERFMLQESAANQLQPKEMEVCQVCGAFLVVNDAPQRVEEHLAGKQHVGYARLRAMIDELKSKIRGDESEREARLLKEREEYEKERQRERDRDRDKDREKEGEKEKKRAEEDTERRAALEKKEKQERDEKDRHRDDRKRHRSRSRSQRRSRSRSGRSKSKRSRSRSRDRRHRSRSRDKHRADSRKRSDSKSRRSGSKTRSGSKHRSESKTSSHSRHHSDAATKSDSRSRVKRSRSRSHERRDSKKHRGGDDRKSSDRSRRSEDKSRRSEDRSRRSEDRSRRSEDKNHKSSERSRRSEEKDVKLEECPSSQHYEETSKYDGERGGDTFESYDAPVSEDHCHESDDVKSGDTH